MAAYISGYSNTMDVAGFGFNTQSAMFYQSQHAALDVHENVKCDGCGICPLRGIRWRCQSCPDHDICNDCKKQGLFAGHPFQIMSVNSTNNQNALANGGTIIPEAGVHWTTCRSCGANPIRGTLYACTVCTGFDLCESCNKDRWMNRPDEHPHRFDFHVMPRARNPPPDRVGVGATGAATYQGGYSQMGQHQQIQHAQQYQQNQGQYQSQSPNLAQPQHGGYEAPAAPYYGEYQSTSDRVIGWLNRHLSSDN